MLIQSVLPTRIGCSRRIHIWLFLYVFIAVAVQARAAAAKPTNAECFACHSDATLSHEVNGHQVSLAVDETKFNGSIHSSFSCVDCHDDLKSAPHDSTPAKVSCAKCHSDEDKAYGHSIHAEAIKTRHNGDAPTCIACHGSPHEILPPSDEKSKVYRTNIPATCGSCHGQKYVMEAAGLSAATYTNYESSVHGKAVAAGSLKAAVCTDCHGSHEILTAADPKSTIYRPNVPFTCAKCHESEKNEFMQSVHGKAVERGNWQAPVCVDCHGIHTIKAPTDPTSSVYGQNLARATCANCHEGMRMSQDFGFDGRRASTYMASYHGLASKLGSTVVANCASCHGAHNILPSSDPRSMVNKANLVKTCGQCHPGATEKFALGKVHIDVPLSADISSIALRWIRKLYIPLILVVIGGMVLHNFLAWRRKAIHIRGMQDRSIVRMTKRQRWQHAALLSSFITLAITGFALAYPDSWLGMVMGETVRRYGHRVAAAVLIGVGVYHVYYVLFTQEGRRSLKDMLPILKDGFDVRDALAYYLGFSSRRPAFGRFTYGEKAEYWALVWGWFIMGLTGSMAWFKIGVGHWLPRWSVDVALSVHFYEAVLATLAIVVWHFYGVIFDPEVYPINWAFWDGKMSRKLYEEEHPLDALRAEMESKALDAKPAEGEATAEPAIAAAAAAAGTPKANAKEAEKEIETASREND